MRYEKDAYNKIELSHYEIQMILAILEKTKRDKEDWFTEQNLEDVKGMFSDIVNKEPDAEVK